MMGENKEETENREETKTKAKEKNKTENDKGTGNRKTDRGTQHKARNAGRRRAH